jgi:enoyl-CoA hydratase
MTDPNIRVETEDGIALVTIDRPKKLNALDSATLGELENAFESLRGDPDVRAAIITGSGDKAFVAGADIRELAEKNPVTGLEAALRGQSVFRKIERLGKPVVAAVNGFALGGGLELALSCHFRLASPNAKLGLPEVSLGAIPGYGGTQRLSRLVGRGRALELILTGEPIDADEAYRIGLVNRVVLQDELLSASRELLSKCIRNAPLALENAIVAVDEGLDVGLEKGLTIEANLFGILCGTEDLREGMNAFLEKRKAEFHGK